MMTPLTSLVPIALCADDYAQSEGVDAAIGELLHLKRLSAVSCFSTAPRWLSHAAPALRELPKGCADIGLHFNLTEGFGQASPYRLPHLILRSFVQALDPGWMTRMLHAQLDAFEQGWGDAPDFIDGHQHVHQLPVVRQVLLQVVKERYAGRPLWIRNTLPTDPRWGGKARILQWLGGAALERDLKRASRHSNSGFAGVYGFDRPDYDVCFADHRANIGKIADITDSKFQNTHKVPVDDFICGHQFVLITHSHIVLLGFIPRKDNHLFRCP